MPSDSGARTDAVPSKGRSQLRAVLARSPLFESLRAPELDEILGLMRPRAFAPGEALCREGEPGTSLFVLVEGVTDVLYPGSDASPGSQTEVRLRSGDAVGEMSLITGEPRSATVLASIPTQALELDEDAFAAVFARYPTVMANVGRIVSRRLSRTRRNLFRERGEAVALLVDGSGARALEAVIAATEAAAARPVTVLDTRAGLEAALAAVEDARLQHGTVLVLVAAGEGMSHVTDQADRTVALVEAATAARLQASDAGIDVALIGDAEPGSGAIRRLSEAGGDPGALSAPDVAWLGRHLSRTKLGLALGAGGAKGYAHLAAVSVLEEAGYTIDYVSGSSIGAIAGAWVALGLTPVELEETMRETFSEDRVAAWFKLSLTGASTGLETMIEGFRESVGERTFEDLAIPLVVMTVDLVSRRPAPITDGPLWEAMVAATALAGMFPPFERGDQRLVDGLALVPVPTRSLVEAGADLTVAVNILNRETLDEWPVDVPHPEARRGRARMLDLLLEVMDLSQLESSVQHAALADVVVSPRFGPSTWRDFHLADLFLDAGRAAMQEQLGALQELARPQSGAGSGVRLS